MWTFSQIEGQAVPEGRVRRWRLSLPEWIFGELGATRASEIGQVHVFTVPELNQECLQDCDSNSGVLETVPSALLKGGDPGLRGPMLVIDSISVKPKYRGRGLATLVAGEAFRWFDGLVKIAALAVPKEHKYRPAAARVVDKLNFRPVDGDIWVREI